MLCDYLVLHHKSDIIQILQDEDFTKHFSLNIKLDQLLQEEPLIANKLLKQFESLTSDFNSSIVIAQKAIQNELNDSSVIKHNVHVRLYNFPSCPELVKATLPSNQDVGLFLEVSGTIIRTTVTKLLEFQRSYQCTKCKEVRIVKADFDQKYLILPPKHCSNSECNGSKFVTVSNLDRTNFKDYQEIKIQEQGSQFTIGLIPNSLWVILEDDLVDSCKPGDNVAICGIVKRRWKLPGVGNRIEVEVVIKANHIFVNNDTSSISVITPQIKEYFSLFWQKYKSDPLKGRDAIVKSFCPQIYGLHIVKLGVMVTLAGGSLFKDSDTKIKTRSEPHLLLVGDAGTGKSQLLKYASKVISRSVFTTGIGSTSAGLTVTAVNENGEWQLEAGALVLSDGGVCCIDEFNSMKEHDRTSIHEAMEQQTLSVAKASIVCKLNTRCSILAATNPKGCLDPSQNFNANIGLPSPLLSRFDLVYILKDSINQNWDSLVGDFILNDAVDEDKQEKLWDLLTLQAYIIYIKRIHPTLTDDTNRILSNYYQLQRKATVRNRARTTVRLLDSLVRLSQAHARLMCHTKVEVVDAIAAVTLIETSMQGDSSALGLGFNIYSANPENPTESYSQLIRTILCKLELDDLLQKELQHIEEQSNDVEQTNDTNKNLDTTVSNKSFKSMFKRNLSATDTIVISKIKNHDHIQDNVKKIKLDLTEDDGINSLKNGGSRVEHLEWKEEPSNDSVVIDVYDSRNPQFIGCDKENVNLLKPPRKPNTKKYLDQFQFKSKKATLNHANINDGKFADFEWTDNNSLITHGINQGFNSTEPLQNTKFENEGNSSKQNLDFVPDEISPIVDKPSQNKRLKNRFDQFRFVPKDQNMNGITEHTEHFQNTKNNATSEAIVKEGKNNINCNASTTDKVRENERCPNTNCVEPRYQFSEDTNYSEVNSNTQSKIYHSQSIFEKQEDYDDLDLEIGEG